MMRGALLLLVGTPLLALAQDGPKPAEPSVEDIANQIVQRLHDPKLDRLVVEKLVAECIKNLDDPVFARRQRATEWLIRIGHPAKEPLHKALAAKPSLEMTARIETILRTLAPPADTGARRLRGVLAKKIDLDKGIDTNTPLKDALEFLADRYDLTILVNGRAFEAIGVNKSEEQPVQLPKMMGVSLSAVLRMLAAQCRGDDATGTFLVHHDHIEITSTKHANPREWAGKDRALAPVVDGAFERQPLDEALEDLAGQTGISILVGGETGGRHRKLVTAHLQGVPLDTAVRVLADMAGLKVAVLDNALYVAPAESCRAVQEETPVKPKDDQPKEAK